MRTSLAYATATCGLPVTGEHRAPGLVVPDREVRLDPPDERHHRARLRLRGRSRARVVAARMWDVAAPSVREVPVQVHPVRVLARVRGEPIRVNRRDRPELRAGQSTRMAGCLALDLLDDAKTGPLIAVNDADDQRDPRPGRIADLHGSDRALLHRPPDELLLARSRSRRVGRRAPSDRSRGHRSQGHPDCEPAAHSARCSPAFSRRSRSSRSSSGVGSNWAGSGSASRPERPKSFSNRGVVP